MENFFIRHSSKTDLGTTKWLYSGGHAVRGGAVYSGVGEKISDIPFVPKHFSALTFEYLFVDENDRIHLMNRNTLKTVEIGHVEDGVVSACASRDEKWFVIVSTSEVLMFDTYIDLRKSIKVELDGFIGIEWTDYDLFAIVTEKKILFYDVELTMVGESSEDRYRGVSWRSKYNTFACCTEECIRFVEPNGLEHGEPLKEVCSSLSFLDDGDLLVTVGDVEGRRVLRILYTKNFQWYQKAEVEIAGEFICTEENKILLRNGEELTTLFLFRERTCCGPEYYVIDKNSVMYTDFSDRIIPPPLFDIKHDFDETIVDISPARRGGVVLHPSKAVVFEISGGRLVEKRMVPLERRFDSVVLFRGCLLLKDSSGVFLEPLEEKENSGVQENSGSMEAEKMQLDIKAVCHLHSVVEKHSPQRVVKCYNFGEKPCLVFEDGTLVYDKEVVHSGMDLGKGFSVSIDKGVFVHNDRTLTVDGRKMEGVTSFLADEHGYVVTTDETCEFYFEARQSMCQVDAELRLLCLVDGKVIGETRHGTLETFTPRIYTLSQTRRLIDQGRYEESIDICQRHAVTFGVFVDSHVDLERLVKSCRSVDLVPFFNSALERLGDLELVLEDEEVRRLRKVFVSDVFMSSDADREYFRRQADDGDFIRRSCVLHLVGPARGCRVDRHVSPSRSGGDGVLCGRSPRRFLEEFLPLLTLEEHFTFTIFLFVKLKRTDLALQVCKHSFVEGVEYMLTIANANSVIHSAMTTLGKGDVLEVLRICQKDASDFLSLVEEWNGDLLRFKINDFLEDRADAFYHLSRMQLVDTEAEYVRRHNLFDEALMYEVCGLSTKEQGFYYELCAGITTPDKALHLLRLAGNREEALRMAVGNLFWREAIDIHGSGEMEELYELLSAGLAEAGRHTEAGQLLEEFVGDTCRAFVEYTKGRNMRDALRLCSDPGYLGRVCRVYLLERLVELEDLKRAFVKYRGRLNAIEEREEDDLSESSFSYTEKIGNSRSTRARGRPGGIYEREFVLGRIRSICTDLVGWRDRNEDLLEVFSRLGMKDCTDAHNEAFCPFAELVRSSIDSMFSNEKTQLHDPNRPVVEKPDLGRWI